MGCFQRIRVISFVGHDVRSFLGRVCHSFFACAMLAVYRKWRNGRSEVKNILEYGLAQVLTLGIFPFEERSYKNEAFNHRSKVGIDSCYANS